MANKKISELVEKTTLLSSNDMLYVSEAAKFGTYGSRKITYENVIQSVRKSFKPEIDLLHEINENYIDGLLDNAEISTIGGRKYMFMYFTTTRGVKRVISVDLQDIANIYSAGEGLCCNNDRQFSVDYDYVAKKEHSHDISAVNELQDELDSKALSIHGHIISDINDLQDKLDEKSNVGHSHEVSDVNDISVLSANAISWVQEQKYLTDHQSLSDYYKKSELSTASEVSTEFKKYQTKGSFLTADALNILSTNWETAYSRVSAATDGLSGNVGSVAYKNKLLTSEIEGYSDTKYSNGYGLSANGTEFGVDTDEIALKKHNHDSQYYTKSELDDKFSEFKGLSKKDIADIVDDKTIKVVSDKLSCVVEGGSSKVIFRNWD